MTVEGTTQMKDYLVRFEVEQWCDGEETTDEIVLRVAGSSEPAAVQGAKVGLEELSHVYDAEPVETWRDHDDTVE